VYWTRIRPWLTASASALPAVTTHRAADVATRMKLVHDSWLPVAGNLDANGVAFFRRIFELAPDLLQLFSFRDEEDLYNSRALKHLATVGPDR
jgi:hypothetical protein